MKTETRVSKGHVYDPNCMYLLKIISPIGVTTGDDVTVTLVYNPSYDGPLEGYINSPDYEVYQVSSTDSVHDMRITETATILRIEIDGRDANTEELLSIMKIHRGPVTVDYNGERLTFHEAAKLYMEISSKRDAKLAAYPAFKAGKIAWDKVMEPRPDLPPISEEELQSFKWNLSSESNVDPKTGLPKK